MPNHTPGPWTASIGTRGASVHLYNNANHPLSFNLYWGGSQEAQALMQEAQANAHLITAAPDLLVAARKALRDLEHSAGLFEASQGEYAGGAARHNKQLVSGLRATASELRAAIAKAEGRS